MKHKLNTEEEALKHKLEQAEFQYQESDWLEVESKLSNQGAMGKYGTLLKAAAALIIISAAAYFLAPEGKQDAIPAISEISEKVVEQKLDKESNPAKAKLAEESQPKVTKKDKKTSTIKNESLASTPKKVQKESNSSQPKVENESQSLTTEKEKEPKTTTIIAPELKGFDVIGKICEGEIIQLRALMNQSASANNLKWSVNNKVVAKGTNNIELQLKEATFYKIKSSIVGSNQEALVSIDTSFEVNPLEEINFTYNDLEGIFTDFTANFEAEPLEYSYTWKVENEVVENSENGTFSHQFPRKGIYDVTLLYSNSAGCQSSITKPVSIQEDFGPFINAFTPNGDDLNNTFIPQAFNDFDGNFKFYVYDINGQILYQSNSIQEPWNGRRNNRGELMPVRNYVWKVIVSDNKGNQRTFTDRVKIVSF